MAQETGVVMDLSVLNDALKEFSVWIHEDSSEVVLDEARLAMVDGMRLSPPYGVNKRKAESTGLPKASAKRQGEAAVERSILNSMRPLLEEEIDSPKLREAVRTDNAEAIRKYLEQSGSRKRLVSFSKRLHQAARSPRSGRVYRDRNQVIRGSERDTLKAYIKQTQQKVGTFKAAWGYMAIRLATHPAAKGGPGARVPAWVRRNVSRGRGLVLEDSIIVTRGRGAEVTFRVQASGDMQTVYSRALAKRGQALVKKMKLARDGVSQRINTRFTVRGR